MDDDSGLAPGVLLFLLGAFVIMRSVTQDDTGRTLINRILGNKPGATATQVPAATTAAPTVKPTVASTVRAPTSTATTPIPSLVGAH